MTKAREEAIGRAESYSPFLRDSLEARPEIARSFLASGAAAAAAELALARAATTLGVELRRQRTGSRWRSRWAILSGELSLEEVTAAAVRFRRSRDRRGRCGGDRASASPDAAPQGFAVIAMGKLGSRELNYSSDVDLLLLFDPATLPTRESRGCRRGRGADRAGG